MPSFLVALFLILSFGTFTSHAQVASPLSTTLQFFRWDCTVNYSIDQFGDFGPTELSILASDNRAAFMHTSNSTRATITISYRPEGFFEWVRLQGLGDSEALVFTLYLKVTDGIHNNDFFFDTAVKHTEDKFSLNGEATLNYLRRANVDISCLRIRP
jgi:hypothetical protein